MHNLYKFLKRNSPLFIPRYGRANRIYDHNTKFLTDKYGKVRYYYGARVELSVIESDIHKLLEERYSEK